MDPNNFDNTKLFGSDFQDLVWAEFEPVVFEVGLISPKGLEGCTSKRRNEQIWRMAYVLYMSASGRAFITSWFGNKSLLSLYPPLICSCFFLSISRREYHIIKNKTSPQRFCWTFKRLVIVTDGFGALPKKALHKADISNVKSWVSWLVSWVGAWLWDLWSNDGKPPILGSRKYVNTIPPRPQPITVANKGGGGNNAGGGGIQGGPLPVLIGVTNTVSGYNPC